MPSSFESFVAGIILSSAIWFVYTTALLRVIDEKSKKVVYLSEYARKIGESNE